MFVRPCMKLVEFMEKYGNFNIDQPKLIIEDLKITFEFTPKGWLRLVKGGQNILFLNPTAAHQLFSFLKDNY